MPIFLYKGYATDGRELKGSIEAPGLHDALAQIRANGILPMNVAQTAGGKKRRFFRRRDDSFLPNFTRQLSILLSSGVPIMEALQSLADEYTGNDRDMLIAVKERLSGGAGLHRALEEYDEIFSDYYIHMIKAGETSGALDAVLEKLADFLEQQGNIRTKIRSSLVYPILMMGVCIVVLSFLFTFVIPKIVRIFADTKGTLPLVTVILISITHLFTKYWWAIIGMIAIATISLKKYFTANRKRWDGLILRMPGNILQSLYYARFARSMEILLSGGVPVVTALKLSAASIGNRSVEDSILSAGEKVVEGQTIASSLQGFPPVFVRLVATGERSGKLSEALKKAASSYEEEFSRKVDRAVSIFEPAIIIAMSLVVCFIVLAVLLPIFQLNTLVK